MLQVGLLNWSGFPSGRRARSELGTESKLECLFLVATLAAEWGRRAQLDRAERGNPKHRQPGRCPHVAECIGGAGHAAVEERTDPDRLVVAHSRERKQQLGA